MCTTLNYPRHAPATPEHLASAFFEDGIDVLVENLEDSDLFFMGFNDIFEGSVLGSAINGVDRTIGSLLSSEEPISRDDFLRSQWYREDFEYHENMTLGDAVLMAQTHDGVFERTVLLDQVDSIADRLEVGKGAIFAAIADPTGFVPLFGRLSRHLPWLSLGRWIARLGPVRGRMAYDVAQAATISALNQPLSWGIRSATGQDVDTSGYGEGIAQSATLGSVMSLIASRRGGQAGGLGAPR